MHMHVLAIPATHENAKIETHFAPPISLVGSDRFDKVAGHYMGPRIIGFRFDSLSLRHYVSSKSNKQLRKIRVHPCKGCSLT